LNDMTIFGDEGRPRSSCHVDGLIDGFRGPLNSSDDVEGAVDTGTAAA
jgi:hypothetical protein